MATKKADLKNPAKKKSYPVPKKKTNRSETGSTSRKAMRDVESSKELKRKIAELGRLASFPLLNPNPVLEVNSSGEIIFKNKAANDFLQKHACEEKADVFLPQDIHAIFKGLHDKQRKEFYREVAIRGKVFGERIYLAPEFNALRIYAHDITEHKKMEAEISRMERSLKKEHDFISTVLSTAGALVVVLDVKGRVVSFNNTCEQVTGYSFDEVKGRHFWDFLLIPEEVEPVKTVFRTLTLGQFPNKFENYWVAKDRTRYLIAWSNTALPDINGNVEYIIGTGIDITERRHVEEALHKSEERYRSFIEVTGQLGWTTDATGKVVEDIVSWRRFTGQKEEEVKGSGWSKALHPEDLEHTIHVWSDAVARRSDYEMEYRIRRYDGVYRYFLARAVPILDSAGDVREWVGTCIDITDRKRMEEEIRKSRDELEIKVLERTKVIREKADIIDSLFKSTITPLVLLDKEFNFIRVNQEYARVCSKKIDDFYGHNHFEFFPHEENEAIFKRVVETKNPYQAVAKPFTFPDHPEWGVTYWDWTLTPLLDAEGEVNFLVFSLNDVTGRKKIEDRDHFVTRLLELFVKKTSRKEYIESVVGVLHQWSGFSCVGIRVADDKGYIPYEAYTGFSDQFWKLENMLSLNKDTCACIRAFNGRFEPQDASVLTENGAVYINNSQNFANNLTKEEFARFRGNCIRSGFLSIALVPINYRGQRIGLIHLADEREGMAQFSTIQFLETVSNLIGEAIHRFNTEEALRKSQASLSEAQRLAHVGNWEWDVDTGLSKWSDEVYRIFSLSPQVKPTYNSFLDFVHSDDRESLEESIKEAFYEKKPFAIDHRIVLPDIGEKTVHERGEIVFNEKGIPLRMVGTIQDVTHVKRIENELRLSEERLRELYAHLHSVRESERAYIAREIHDEFGTILTALNIDLSWLEKKIPKDHQTLMERVSKDVELVNSAIKMVQRISSELRPAVLDYLGLPSAVEWQVKEFGNRTGIEWNIDIDMKTADLDNDLTIAFFRILQESLTNIARYAEATKINVALHENDGFLTLEVTDNGKGVSEEQLSDPNSLGIFGMRERVQYFGGVIDITGIPHKGTTVAVKVPVVKQGA